jgi:hypothetical protein
VGGSGRGVGDGGGGVAVGVGTGVIVGTGVAVGGGAANRWLPRRAPMMSTAMPRETSRIMAPRATSSCRLCRQFILLSALDSGLGDHAHRANSCRLARSRHLGRGTAKPSGICGMAQVRHTSRFLGATSPHIDRIEGSRYDPAHFTSGGAPDTRVCDHHCAEPPLGSSASPAGAGNPGPQDNRMHGCIRQ